MIRHVLVALVAVLLLMSAGGAAPLSLPASAGPGAEPPAAPDAPPAAPDPAPPGGEGPGAEFVGKFAENLVAAEFLAGYDLIAWCSGDAFLALPAGDREGTTNWFCYVEKDQWHAVYGKWDGEKAEFRRMVHFRLDPSGKIVRLDDLSGRDFDVPYCRVLADSGPRFRAVKESGKARFNPYLRPVKDGIETWALPPVVEGFRILHGVSYRWRYSADGKEFKGEDRYGGNLRAVTPAPDKVTLIGDPEQEIPTVGDIFVVLRFGDRFFALGILSRFGYSMVMSGMWVHNAVDDDPAPRTESAPAKKPGSTEAEGPATK
ncbi:MAG: hypothetical protein MUE73_17310 [Planctomycetes bacterium]|jgi:hypothetical protein|nr:hypothetical protein [Planctomycetota bacterium]